jgi:putative DNA primase/helicase
MAMRDVMQELSANARGEGLKLLPHGFKPTDYGNAERLVARFRDRIRFCPQRNKWMIWDGARWSFDETGEIVRLAKLTVRGIYEEASACADDEGRKMVVRFASKSEDSGRLAAMIKLAQSEPGIPVMPADLDADPWKLTVLNGTIDLKTATLGPHCRSDLITKITPIVWEPSASCPTWLRFLDDVMGGNKNMIAFLQRAVGYTLTGDTREQVLFFTLGAGANGKTTFLKTIQALLGEFATQAAPDLLIAKKGEVHPTEQADLFGKRLAVCTEIESGRALAEVTVKQLTGGDAIKARRMREDFWEFEPTHKLWIAANHKPIVKGTDHAIWRRLLMILFGVTFTADRRDPELIQKLHAELPGILRWAVAGCVEWQRGGLKPPAEVRDATESYRGEMDVVGQFVAERCARDLRGEITAAALYRAYSAWCEANGERAVKQRAFGQAMTERGVERTKRGTYIYLGIRLADQRDDVDEDPGSTQTLQLVRAYTGSSSESSLTSGPPSQSETTPSDWTAGDEERWAALPYVCRPSRSEFSRGGQ